MSGLDPDEDAIITENPDPESESAAVNESESVEENLDDRTEGEINAYEGSGEIVPRDNDPDVNVFREESVVRENEPRIEECVLNQDGDEKTEDEREPGVGVIREGQISGGRDEQLSQSLGQEEAEADTFLVREACSNESVGIRNSEEVLCEHDSAYSQGLEHSDSRSADIQESESHCEESTSVISGRDADSDAGSRECNHDSLENLSRENSEVVENHVIIPEDELSCQVWTAEDKPQLQVLSPTGSIESCEPECDQETDASPSHGVRSEHVDRLDSNETHQQGGGGRGEEEEREEGNEEVAEEEETICVVLNPPPPHSSSSDESQTQPVCESSSDSSSQVRSVETTSCSSQETLAVSCSGSMNGDLAPVTNNFSENKISSVESDDDLLSELESELTNGSRANQNNHNMHDPEVKFKPPNGIDGKVLQEIQDLQMQLKHSRAKIAEKDSEINR